MVKKKEEGQQQIISDALALSLALREKLKQLEFAKLTAEERLNSGGKLRDGEDAAMASILQVMDEHPSYFSALADKDGGVDDSRIETQPSRAALERRRSLAPVLRVLEEVTTSVSDEVLVNGEMVRNLTMPAYAIAKANCAFDPRLKRSLAPARDFYAQLARRRARPQAKR